MKILKFILLFTLIISCKQDVPVDEPENLLSKDKMVNILYDVALLQASVNYKPEIVNDSINVEQYIYEKYNIDSITFYQNQKFYASDVKELRSIYKQVLEKIKQEEGKLNESTNEEINENKEE